MQRDKISHPVSSLGIRICIKTRQRRNDELRSDSVMQRVHIQTGTTALRVVPLMRREKTANWVNKPLRIIKILQRNDDTG
jgi:hypothetical protein